MKTERYAVSKPCCRTILFSDLQWDCYISNLTGTWISNEQAVSPDYWAQQLRHTVQFSAGISELLQQNRIFVEVGPGTTLSTLVKQQTTTARVTHSLPHPKAQTSDQAQLLQALGELWLTGISPDWSGFYAKEKRKLLPLPTYPFQRQRYWIDPPTVSTGETSSELRKNENLSEWFYVPSWKRELLPPENPHLSTSWLIFLDTTKRRSSCYSSSWKYIHSTGRTAL